MENQRMNKEDVLNATIGVLSDISVPVGLYDQITAPIKGAIHNLIIVLQLIEAEKEEAKRNQDNASEAETQKRPAVLPMKKERSRNDSKTDAK